MSKTPGAPSAEIFAYSFYGTGALLVILSILSIFVTPIRARFRKIAAPFAFFSASMGTVCVFTFSCTYLFLLAAQIPALVSGNPYLIRFQHPLGSYSWLLPLYFSSSLATQLFWLKQARSSPLFCAIISSLNLLPYLLRYILPLWLVRHIAS